MTKISAMLIVALFAVNTSKAIRESQPQDGVTAKSQPAPQI